MQKLSKLGKRDIILHMTVKKKVAKKIANDVDTKVLKTISLFQKYEKDLAILIKKGDSLTLAMRYNCEPSKFKERAQEAFKHDKKRLKDLFDKLPNFNSEYQSWYSEAQVLIKQLLPNRLEDFIRLYEKPKGRKSIEFGNYVMEDFLQGLRVTYDGNIKVDMSAAIPQFEQQLNIVKALEQRFKSTLFDIRQLVQADLFDSELDAARSLLNNKFNRAAGAMAGVVLESHLAQVAENHNLTTPKLHPTISDWNDLLKKADVIETEQWRKIQYLGDLRNLCDHKKSVDPSKENIEDLINGVEKVSKTIF